jgi:hypothetical protein
MPSGIQHLLVIEFRKEIVEPARSELVAGEFQPFLGHGEECGAGVRVGGMSRQIKTLGRCPSKVAGVIVLHDGIMILPRRSFPAALENEILLRAGPSNSLRTGNLAGNFSGCGPFGRFSCPIDQINQRLAPKFPETLGTGEFFRREQGIFSA